MVVCSDDKSCLFRVSKTNHQCTSLSVGVDTPTTRIICHIDSVPQMCELTAENSVPQMCELTAENVESAVPGFFSLYTCQTSAATQKWSHAAMTNRASWGWSLFGSHPRDVVHMAVGRTCCSGVMFDGNGPQGITRTKSSANFLSVGSTDAAAEHACARSAGAVESACIE